ncbi:MAG TPA: DUF2442 domain-containing protein [Longimicrobium sp.]|nr:DUF2442 domain-containing protein [Longimicrobium sp.]
MKREWKPLGGAELDRQISEATERGRAEDASQPRARSARYDEESGRVVIELTNGCLFAFPAELAQGLRGAAPELLARVEVDPGGAGLHWEELDADLGVAGLVAGVFGSRAWMRESARRMGSATSERKRAASRANGARGGRPRSDAA